MIDKWLHDAILTIVVNALSAEGMIGVVAINDTTIHGHLWTKYRQRYSDKQGTPAFQFFFRVPEWDQVARVNAIVQRMKDNAEIRTETKAKKDRFVPTTALDELARILKVEGDCG